jgi:hypothetical protein
MAPQVRTNESYPQVTPRGSVRVKAKGMVQLAKLQKSRALRGLTPGKYFSPFYDFGRRFLGFSPATLDEYLEARGSADLDGHNVVLSHDGCKIYGHVGVAHRAHAAKWVNQFNQRSQAAEIATGQ